MLGYSKTPLYIRCRIKQGNNERATFTTTKTKRLFKKPTKKPK